MFKAITRFFKTVTRLFSGKINETTDGIAEDTHVIREEYDEVIRRHTCSVRDVRDAVAGLMAQQERKKEQADSLSN